MDLIVCLIQLHQQGEALAAAIALLEPVVDQGAADIMVVREAQEQLIKDTPELQEQVPVHLIVQEVAVVQHKHLHSLVHLVEV